MTSRRFSIAGALRPRQRADLVLLVDRDIDREVALRNL
jgi:hypothetical protein